MNRHDRRKLAKKIVTNLGKGGKIMTPDVTKIKTAKTPTKTTTSTKPTLTFLEIIPLLLEGNKASRVEWGSDSIYLFMKDEFMQIHKADGKDYYLLLSAGDMQGEDWVIL